MSLFSYKLVVMLLVFCSCAIISSIMVKILQRKYKEQEGKYIDETSRNLDDMFLSMKPEKILQMTIVLILSLALFFYFVTGSVFVAIVFSSVGYFSPKLLIRRLKAKRIERFGNQLIVALSNMANSLKAGFNLTQAIDLIAKDMPSPISQEFGLVISENALGVTLDESLLHLVDRIQTEDASLMATSIIIARETGGNLSEIFDHIAGTIRERHRIEEKIKSLTAQGKMQGYVMGFLPIVMGIIFSLIDPAMMKPLFTTPFGWFMIFVLIILETMGFVVIRKIVAIDI